MQREMKAESYTAFTGTSCLLTLCHADENGIAPSLENAQVILIERAEVGVSYCPIGNPNQK
jgi:hypothetical protein